MYWMPKLGTQALCSTHWKSAVVGRGSLPRAPNESRNVSDEKRERGATCAVGLIRAGNQQHEQRADERPSHTIRLSSTFSRSFSAPG